MKQEYCFLNLLHHVDLEKQETDWKHWAVVTSRNGLRNVTLISPKIHWVHYCEADENTNDILGEMNRTATYIVLNF